jgi:opacity protein-like surface antigen
VRWTFLGFAAVLGWASEAGAQGAPGVRFGVSGGASIPVQNQDDVYQLGWNATAMVLFNFDAPVGIRLDGSYGEMNTKNDLPGFVGTGSARIISGTADLVLGPRHGWIQPYFLGGVGVYDLRFKGQEVDGSDLFSDSTTRFGWNAGLGFAFPLSQSDNASRIFVEGRYTSVSLSGDRFTDSVTTEGSRFTFVPVNVGIVF